MPPTVPNISCQQSIEQDRLLAEALAREGVEENAAAAVDCSQDAMLAKILQKQFDLEHDNQITRQEARLNGQSKVGISLDKFRRSMAKKKASGALANDEDDYEDEDDGDNNDARHDCQTSSNPAWDVFEKNELKQRSRLLGRSGFVVDEHGNMITKHDIPTSSRRNMRRLMEMKTDIDTGDAGTCKDDLKITNYVYNILKVHSKKNLKRISQKSFEKRERENAILSPDVQSLKLNEATNAIIDELLVTTKVEKLNGVVGVGKESCVIHALGKDLDGKVSEMAIKIFKNNSTVAFKSRETYNKSKCPSFKFDKPRSKNDALNKWSERGYKNLKALRRAGISCPEAILLRKHVLVMSFIGDEGNPAPQLRQAQLDKDQLRSSCHQVKDMMIKMYELDFVHSDLSEYNLLWWNNQAYVIDVSQMVSRSHPNANRFLLRDCYNFVKFYNKHGLTDIGDFKSLFSLICGKDLSEKDVEFWSKIEDFPCNEKNMQKDENNVDTFGTPDTFENLIQHTKDGLKEQIAGTTSKKNKNKSKNKKSLKNIDAAETIKENIKCNDKIKSTEEDNNESDVEDDANHFKPKDEPMTKPTRSAKKAVVSA